MPPPASEKANHAQDTREKGRVARHPVLVYFVLTFLISWLGAAAVAAPHLLRREPLPKLTGILMFPAMLLGPPATCLLLTAYLDGAAGIRRLFSSLARRFALRWMLALLLPPAVVLGVLLALERLGAPAFEPNRFLAGFAFAIPAGILEEIGWTGFAFPRLCATRTAFSAAVLVGLLWSLWHFPVIDFLGVATPHAQYLWPFFASFALAMTAMRVVIAWVYTNTASLLLAQLMHISSTGALVVFGPPRVNAREESLWYGIYALALCVTAGLIVTAHGKTLRRSNPSGPRSHR